VFSPDAKKLLAIHFGKLLRVWGVPSGELLYRLEASGNTLHSAVFSADGRSVIIGSDREHDAMQVVDLTSKERRRLRTSQGSDCFAFAPNGKTLAVGANLGEISIVDPENWTTS
jgi:WD40 repeat protein